jgi:hypothetical protein
MWRKQVGNTGFLRSKSSHFLISLFVMTFFVYLQSCLFANVKSRWFHIDLITIAVIYLSIEHFMPFALFKIIYTGLLLQVHSAVPSGFYVMYFLLVFVFSNLLSKIFLFHSLFGQFFIFLIIFFFKYFLLYLSITPRDFLSLMSLVSISWKGFIITAIITLPLLKLFSYVDSFFEFTYSNEKKKAMSF